MPGPFPAPPPKPGKSALGTRLALKFILGDPGADSGGEGKSKRAEK